MTPLLFGPVSRQLFGLYHAAQGGADGGLAVLICAPFGQEAIRSHRLFRLLADRLSRAGVAVLRFDYFGAGDSPGDDADGEFEGWRRDVCAAHEELRRRTGARRIVWLGARLGATLTLLAARNGRCDPARLVLWDPIVSGSDYLELLRQHHVEALERSFCVSDPSWRRRLAQDSNAFTDQALGFAIGPTLLQQLRSLRPNDLQLTTLHETVVLADEADNPPVERWCRDQTSRGVPLRFSSLRHSLMWTSDPHPHKDLVPMEALQQLMASIS